MSRLPIPGSDSEVWGDILNDFLLRSHNSDGTLRTRVVSDQHIVSVSQDKVVGLTADLATKANDAEVVHKSQNETLTGSLTFPEQLARTGQMIMHTTNNPSGFVQKNIIFQDEGPLSRGGPVWMDASGRIQAWLGWHDLIPDGSAHHGVEVKTSAAPNGANPQALVTRFRLKSDSDQTQAAFYSCEMLYIENGIYSPDTAFGITFNTPQSGSVAEGTSVGKYTLGKLTYSVDSTGVATMDIGAGLDNTTGGKVRFFRDSNVPTASVAVYAADGSANQVFFIDAKTGNVALSGRLQYKTSGGTALHNQDATLDASGHTIVENDPLTQDTTKNASVRVFRNTNTTGTKTFRILKGDGTNTDSFIINAGTGDVTVSGNLNVSGSITANNTFDEFELRRTSDASTMSRLLASSNCNLTTGTVYGILAYAKNAATFSKIRFATGTTAPSGLTDLRLGVYNASNVLLASTGNLSASVTSASTLYDNLALSSGITTTSGQQLYLAVAYTGTSLSVKGTTLATGMAGLSPVCAKTTSYAGGSLPSLGSGATSNVAWIELVP